MGEAMKELFALVGMKYRPEEARKHFASLPNGAPLVLKREPLNQHDGFAVQVWSGDHMIGYVAKGPNQNQQLAMAMDRTPEASEGAPAKLAIDGWRWPLIQIGED